MYPQNQGDVRSMGNPGYTVTGKIVYDWWAVVRFQLVIKYKSSASWVFAYLCGDSFKLLIIIFCFSFTFLWVVVSHRWTWELKVLFLWLC
jgi:hypothetical protein